MGRATLLLLALLIPTLPGCWTPTSADYNLGAQKGDVFELVEDCFLLKCTPRERVPFILIVPPGSNLVPFSVNDYKGKQREGLELPYPGYSVEGIVEKGTRYECTGVYSRYEVLSRDIRVAWKILNGPYAGRTDITPRHTQLLAGDTIAEEGKGHPFVVKLPPRSQGQ